MDIFRQEDNELTETLAAAAEATLRPSERDLTCLFKLVTISRSLLVSLSSTFGSFKAFRYAVLVLFPFLARPSLVLRSMLNEMPKI